MSSRIALVTGASRGIGRAIAARLARLGLTVIGTATSASGCKAITQSLGDGHFALPLEVQTQAGIEDFLARLSECLDGQCVSILVNNAGITRDDLSLRMSDQAWEDVLRVNLSAVFYLTKALLRPMIKQRWGRIVSVTSVIGHSGNAGQANYAAAKAGVAGLNKSLAKEVGSRGITVNCVSPGFIDTDMTAGLKEEQKAHVLQSVPMRRLGTVEEVAAAVAFLVSEEASYITGSTLHVNGGMYPG